MTDRDDLLKEARELLASDHEAELQALGGGGGGCVNPESYERIKGLLERVLAFDPACDEARAGLAICEEMLTPFFPVQHMMPLEPVAIRPEALEAPAPPPVEPSTPPTPWEVLRGMRAGQQEGIRFTQQAFAKARRRARTEWGDLVDEAAARAREPGADADAVLAEASARLEELQQRYHRGWKGHGPEFLDDALAALREAIANLAD